MKHPENSCQGKIKYTSKSEANKSAASMNKLGGSRVRSYDCKICGSVHTGHESKGKMCKPSKKQQKIDYVHVSKTHKVVNKFLKDESR